MHPDRHLSPDCGAGKHGGCSGDAWCDTEDGPADCECTCHVVDLRDRKLWSPTSGWVEWDAPSGTWVPMKPETSRQLALWGDVIAHEVAHD